MSTLSTPTRETYLLLICKITYSKSESPMSQTKDDIVERLLLPPYLPAGEFSCDEVPQANGVWDFGFCS